MSQELLVERLFETLVNGDRPSARAIVAETVQQNIPAATLLTDLFWPAHEMIEKLHRSDQMTNVCYHLSTRLLRMLVDQASGRLTIPENRSRTVFAVCGQSQGEELAAQMAVDLLEANGFEVAFSGGGIPSDEVLSQVHERRPDVLLMFASAASDLPDIRHVIDTLDEIAACPQTQIVVGGGVFNRAEGLAEEVGADLWAYSPADLVDLLVATPERAAVIERRAQPAPSATVVKKRRRAA